MRENGNMILNIYEKLPDFKARFYRGYNVYIKELNSLEQEKDLGISIKQKELLLAVLELKVLYEEILFPMFGVNLFYETLNSSNTSKEDVRDDEKVSIQINNYLFENEQFDEILEIHNAFIKMIAALDIPIDVSSKNSLQQVIQIIRGISK
ncbi:hypothetical protein [Neobacillus niacini]|uniref:hypothetical protein n=1 Tax=Neobacillus niacini TaxID=86668 RepID=UPI001C8D0DB0|nr:hypothetical protein [Neobacillus niacini]MBY0145099.1 hypothetical protein [Neobacillus niacini]